MTYDEKIRKVRTARNILSKLEGSGILENNLSEEQITAIRIAEYALDELWKSKEGQPVKHGQWKTPVSVGNGIKFCSVCRNEAYWDTDYGQQLFNYCPYCGARMDLKDSDDDETL